MIACKNCKHYRGLPHVAVHLGPSFVARFPMCVHPSRRQEDPVYGTTLVDKPCAVARHEANDCGYGARMFEPSLRHRIVTALFGGKADDL